MAAGIFYGEPFGCGGVVEGLVGRDQRDGAEAVRLVAAVDFERHGELHGVVGAQRVRVAEPHGLVQQIGRHLDDDVPRGEMLAEAAEDRRRARRREGLPFVAARDGAGDFDGGDVGDVDEPGRALAREAAYPGGAGLQDIALDQGAGIDEEGG